MSKRESWREGTNISLAPISRVDLLSEGGVISLGLVQTYLSAAGGAAWKPRLNPDGWHLLF